MRFYFSCFFACLSLALCAVSPSGTLPVLYIETENRQSVTSKDYYLNATYWLDPLQTGEQAFGSQSQPLTTQIKGRGNWTWNGFDKKPYRLKLEQKTALLGLDANRHFGLLAHADDTKGFLRNTVGFWLAEHIGMAWTPKQRPVEVVLNGDYIGLYFLTELIRVDKKRVAITEQPDLCTDPDSITGGWLVEIDNYYDDPHVLIKEGDGQDIVFTYKSPELLSAQQTQFLQSQMTTIDQLIYGDKQSADLWNYLDITALAQFFIVQELVDNYESFHGSCYLHRDMGATEKWHFGPVWDFGSSFNYDKTQPFFSGREHHNTWAYQLSLFPAFQAEVEREWSRFYYAAFDSVFTYTTSFVQSISAAAKQDALRWQNKGYGNSDIQSDLPEVQRKLRQAAQWMTSQYGLLPESIPQTTDSSSRPRKVLTPDGHIYIIRGDIVYPLL